MHKSNGKYYINCCDCDKEFEVGKNTYYKTNIDRYCLKCRLKRINASKSQRKYIILKCEDCSKEFLIEQKRAQQRYQKYTKHLCTSCSKKGDKNPFYDKTFTEQQKQSLSNIRTAYYNDEQYGIQRRQEVSVRTTGSNNPMYKGAEFVSNYTWRSKTLRYKALQRYGLICMKCHKHFTEKDLIVHHKNSCNWDKDGRLNLENVSILCLEDHKKFHSLYGYGNNTIKQFEEFLKKGSETRTDVRSL